ncbi:rRNA small subunit methyltransferase B [Actinomyces bowdenii]|uniref:rRNA small subunit methyltransferase B n=1 Tax=Actinomyces bowdenii TaxID=131109 RepID=A0A853EKJ8_9ACTO|nr:transcription antitermination factor NusB [Actinomyces bowdenii]MBF0696559.1 rRNA small subunit methyltransferase B [Actinomyces bowdenii]NYS68732.1 rRNA small subunit methyltransferase B [Actinomyces bowdenii]
MAAGRTGGHQRPAGRSHGKGQHRQHRQQHQQRGHAGIQGREQGPAGRGGRGGRRAPRGGADARQVALEVLTRVGRDGAFANLALPPALDAAGLDSRDAALATALTYGTLRLQGRYDAIIALCLDRPLEGLDDVVLDLLRLGAHQLLGMRVPGHAAVSATVDLARRSAGHGAAGLVNAVLRRISAKDLGQWIALLREQAADEVTALAQVESHPLWVVKDLRQALVAHGRPAEELAALLAADNADPEVVLCARPGLIAPERLAKEARLATGQEPTGGAVSPCAVILAGGDPGRIRAVRDARAAVEDEGSQLVALMAAQAPLEGRDERWLDLCAGPGGKAALLGALAAQRGAHLVANEITAHRADLVRSAVRALAPEVVEVRQDDGRVYGEQEPGRYDRVLVDAPCSGLGSLRRRPESRWRRSRGDVTELAQLQRELLTSALRAVRRGGVVAYVTCSPHALETELVVRDVLRRQEREGLGVEVLHAGDAATRIAPRPPAGAEREMLQLWPHLDGTDAMFCALLRVTSRADR